jgi:hypothetical protein
MSGDRTEGRRRNRRAFQPTLDGQLESRVVLSTIPGRAFIAHPQIGFAYAHNNPPFLSQHARPFPRGFNSTPHAAVFTAHGGQSAHVIMNGGGFSLSLVEFQATPVAGVTNPTNLQTTTVTGQATSASGPIQVKGTIRVYPLAGGQIGVIVDGTNNLTELDINPLPFPQRKSYAHSFAYGFAGRPSTINIASIDVTSGSIGAILGYHTANLTGPLTIDGNGNTDRIAFNSMTPGSSIVTGGDINTLDVYNSANLSGANTGISVGRDLNFMNIGGDLTLSNGANLFVGRNLGNVPQPTKGSETGIAQPTSTLTNQLNAGMLVQGNLFIGQGSSFRVAGELSPGVNTQPATVVIRGNLEGAARFIVPGLIPGGQHQNIFIGGSVT